MLLPESDPSPHDSSLLLCLPDDVFATVSRFLIPREVFNLSLCCKSLYALATSEKVWLTQCDIIGIVSHKDLVEWRECVSSYKALCRFLSSVKPLIGIWVQQNPELGNLVYVMPGFVSVVACRIIPQEIVSSGSIQDGSILWSPVFEIVCDFDGSDMFFLHGREEKGIDCVYHGSVKCVNRFCNLLLLEVESLKHDNNEALVPFSKLGYRDRKKLLEVTTNSSQVRLEVPNYANDPLFPRSRDDYINFQKDLVLLKERREFLIQMTQMYKLGCIQIENKENSREEEVGSMQFEVNEVRKSLDYSKALSFPPSNENGHTQCIKRKSLGGYFWGGFKHIFGRSSSIDGCVFNIDQQHDTITETRDDRSSSSTVGNVDKQQNTNAGTGEDRSSSTIDGSVISNNQQHNTTAGTRNDRMMDSSSHETKRDKLQDFLKSRDTLRLTLKALTANLSSFRGWPNMNKNWFALYKMPLQVPKVDQVYAGLWGGTFGWPHEKSSQDKPRKPLFFLLLSYSESKGQQFLIGTKILEGTCYAMHPNGSAMFTVNINEPSSDPFPWKTDRNSLSMNNIEHAFMGEGIASGYGFKYPGSKPGSLFVFQNGDLAFVWKESRDVLTLRRLNLQELLKKGKKIPSLPPIDNFSYLMKSYLNVFTS
ncbi:putative F-box protein At5g39480 isoform X1 [Vicia villosa]|uniref:putative F-box protein At5g39480 isoform X1 n=1 Tax=Vicia villosa TaxID=3911 RepID=UPI00273C440C|nr:putative F-box protein At5g39480 isoform X1 [Vicia villosa]